MAALPSRKYTTAVDQMLPIKFPEMLATLLTDGKFSGTRKELCAKVGISPSLLSQLIRGQSRPSLDTLVRLACVLDVSLDYLVLGVEQQAELRLVEYDTLAQRFDLSLARLQAQNDERSDLLVRVARVLAQQIDRATQLVSSQGPPIGGALRDDEALVLEQYSDETWVLSMNLQYDLHGLVGWEGPGQPPDRVRHAGTGSDAAPAEQPGAAMTISFLPVVASNLSRGARYRFLLPTAARDWRAIVDAYRELLFKACPDRRLVYNNCQFRLTNTPVLVVGCALYQLDVGRLEREQPLLFEQVCHVARDGWLGYMIPPSPEPQTNTLMDYFHRQQAVKAFDDLWKKGRRI